MTHVLKTALIAALMASTAHAQTAPSPFGHWEGVINSPLGSQAFEVDIGPGEDGPRAALGIPAEKIAGLPLGNLTVVQSEVSFELPGKGAGKFTGSLSADGKTLSGIMQKPFGDADFNMTRTGEARFAAEPVNAAIEKRFEGEWAGEMGANKLRLTLANTAKGSVGRMFVDGGAGIPLGVAQIGDQLRLDIVSAKEAFTVVLGATGELGGEYASNSGVRRQVVLKRKG